MCGIAGILPFDGPSDTEKLHAMVSSIEHRGPDQKNIFQNSLGIFGFLRLKIIDLSNKSNQPLSSKDKKVQIIYNGEIYNFKKLKESYFPKKDFFSEGDGEIILHLYEKFRYPFRKNQRNVLNLYYRSKYQKVFLIRDRFGIKPLYFKKKE